MKQQQNQIRLGRDPIRAIRFLNACVQSGCLSVGWTKHCRPKWVMANCPQRNLPMATSIVSRH
jgi:hypothetical protein